MEEHLIGLHHCKDISNFSQNVDYFNQVDGNCLRLLDEEYRPSGKPIGYGGYGVVFKIVPKRVPDAERSIAVKLLPSKQETVDEIFTACQIDRQLIARGRIRAFSRVYGWLVCDQLPDSWSIFLDAFIKEMDEKKKYPVQIIPKNLEKFFIFSELHWMSLDRYRFTSLYEFKCFVFEILHAIYMARLLTGFIHGDLHTGNILIHTQDTGRAEFQVENSHYRIDIDIRPKIIDFGRSTFNVLHRKVEDPNYDDIQFFLTSISRNVSEAGHPLDVIDFILHHLSQFRGRNYDPKEIMESSLFSDLRIEGIGQKVLQCFNCGGTAKMHYQTAPSYMFCQESCAKQFGLIGKLIRE